MGCNITCTKPRTKATSYSLRDVCRSQLWPPSALVELVL